MIWELLFKSKIENMGLVYRLFGILLVVALTIGLQSCSSGRSSVPPPAVSANSILLTLSDGGELLVVEDEVVLTFKANVTTAERQAVEDYLKSHQASIVGEIPEIQMVQVKVNSTQLPQMRSALAGFQGVRQVTPNILLTP